MCVCCADDDQVEGIKYSGASVICSSALISFFCPGFRSPLTLNKVAVERHAHHCGSEPHCSWVEPEQRSQQVAPSLGLGGRRRPSSLELWSSTHSRRIQRTNTVVHVEQIQSNVNMGVWGCGQIVECKSEYCLSDGGVREKVRGSDITIHQTLRGARNAKRWSCNQ